MLILLELQLLDLLLEVSDGSVEGNDISNDHVVGLSVLVNEVRVSTEASESGSEQESEQSTSDAGLLSGLELLGRRADGGSSLSSLSGGLGAGGGSLGSRRHVGSSVGSSVGSIVGSIVDVVGHVVGGVVDVVSSSVLDSHGLGLGRGGGAGLDLGRSGRHSDGVGSGGVASGGGSSHSGRSGDGSDHCVVIFCRQTPVLSRASFTLLMCCEMFDFEFSLLGSALTAKMASCDWVDVCIMVKNIFVGAETAQLISS